MKNKPFITANVREITDAWLREDISYSKMVEMLNDAFFQFYEKDIKCTGNNGNGCYMDSCGHNCGCEGIKN